MGAYYSLYVKTIETHARVFLTLNILAIAWVLRNFYIMALIGNHAKMKCPTWNVIFGTLLAHMPRQLQEQLNFASIKLFALQSGTIRVANVVTVHNDLLTQ